MDGFRVGWSKERLMLLIIALLYIYSVWKYVFFSQEQLEEIFSPPHLRKVRAEFDSKVQQYISEVSVPKGRYLMSLMVPKPKIDFNIFLARCSNWVSSTLELFAFLESLSTLALFSYIFHPSRYFVINSCADITHKQHLHNLSEPAKKNSIKMFSAFETSSQAR